MGSVGPNNPGDGGGGGLQRGGPAKPGERVIPFGKYLLLDRIAVGGMAEIYTAKSFGVEGFEKIIAVKRILPTMAEDEDFIHMFIDEAKIAGHLNHANIAPIYELGKIGESHYIALEYVWGKDLLQMMNRFRKMRRHMPPSMAAWIGSKMCEGLDYAHRKKDRHGRPLNIIHRDVSPQNCLVSYEGQVKMIDFGIAKAAARNTKTQAGVLKGKFGYMSPEQVRGLPVDHRSDVFAVGTCMYEMLTTERLFVGESDFSTLEKVRHASVPPLSVAVPDVPKELEEIVMKALTREVEDRWQSAGEMQEALQRYISKERPPFGTSKLAAWMKTAFAAEITKEKARLDSFAKVGPPAASVPPRPPPPKPPSDDDEPAEMVGEATMITSSPFEAMLEGGEGASSDDLMGQATQIFFSADDVEDAPPATAAPVVPSPVIAVAAPRAVGTPGPPRPPTMMGMGRPLAPTAPEAYAPTVVPPEPQQPQMAAQPGYGAAMGQPQMGQPQMGQPQGYPGQPQGYGAAGYPQAQQGYGQPQGAPPGFGQPPGAMPGAPYAAPNPTGGFAPVPQGFSPSRGQATMELQVPPPQQQSGSRRGLIVVAALGVAALIGLAVGGAMLLGGPAVGTIEIHTVPEAAQADVIVDGTPRGRAPLRLDHVAAGDHTLLVQASGYAPISRTITVAANGTAMLDLVLSPAAGGPAVALAVPPAAAPPVAPLAAAAVVAPAVAIDPATGLPVGVPVAPVIDPATGLPVGVPPVAPIAAEALPPVAPAAPATTGALPTAVAPPTAATPPTGATTAPAAGGGTTAAASGGTTAAASGGTTAAASSGSSGSSGSAASSGTASGGTARSGGSSGSASGSGSSGSSGRTASSGSSGSTGSSSGSSGSSGPTRLPTGIGGGSGSASSGSGSSGSTGPVVGLPRRGGGAAASGSTGSSAGTGASGSGSSGGTAAPEGGSTRGRGTLVIQTLPWARVFLDGRDTGRNTPVRELSVSAGTHRLGLRTHDGTMHEESVTVGAGETLRIVRQF